MKNILIKESYDEISAWCDDMEIKSYSINPDESIDAPMGVNIRKVGIHDLPFKFNTVNGNFHAEYNHLVSLDNMPKTVNGSFYVCDNSIQSLTGFPKLVTGNVDLSGNEGITSLYVGDYDVIINGNIYIYSINLPRELSNFVWDEVETDNSSEYLRIIFKYQRHFEIWNKDESLNVENFNELVHEIKDGLQ